MDVSLHTAKINNLDNTISSVYALISVINDPNKLINNLLSEETYPFTHSIDFPN